MNAVVKVADKRFSLIALVPGQILFAITAFLWTANSTYSISAVQKPTQPIFASICLS